jgi:thiosulfate dehydrogenase
MQTSSQTGILLLALSLIPGISIAAANAPHATALTKPVEVKPFIPPQEKDIPDNQFGKMVKLGKKIFVQTGKYASKYVGNKMQCVNCHLGAGRLVNSAPLWAAWVRYPKYRGKNKMVNTMEERFQGCFRYSMNGTPPPSDSETLKALMSYSFWLASGAPTNINLPGRGYPKIAKPDKSPDYARGKKAFETNCAICHGSDGQGTTTHGQYIFPPLWGKGSFNWGAGMHRINTAASFIRANMPLGKGGTLSVQQAWDVAYYINSHERPQDPRFKGNIEETDKKFHAHQCRYGDNFNHHVLGKK